MTASWSIAGPPARRRRPIAAESPATGGPSESSRGRANSRPGRPADDYGRAGQGARWPASPRPPAGRPSQSQDWTVTDNSESVDRHSRVRVTRHRRALRVSRPSMIIPSQWRGLARFWSITGRPVTAGRSPRVPHHRRAVRVHRRRRAGSSESRGSPDVVKQVDRLGRPP